MPFDGILFTKISQIIKDDLPLRVNRIEQISKHDYVFKLYHPEKQDLLISTHPQNARFHYIARKQYPRLHHEFFLQRLRHSIEGGFLTSIKQLSNDRILFFNFEKRDEMGVIQSTQLVFEVLGRFANLILLDSNDRIVDAFHKSSDFEGRHHSILPKAPYIIRPSEKKDFKEILKSKPDQIYMQNYHGISPILEKEINFRLEFQSMNDIYKEILNSKTLFLYKNEYHIIELKHLQTRAQTFPIMKGLTHFYQQKQEQSIIESHTQNLKKILSREAKKAKRKLQKLELEYKQSLKAEELLTKAELLMTYGSQLNKGLKKTTLKNFDGAAVDIKLDPKLNGVENAQKYYKLYRKQKNAQTILTKQIEETILSLEYLDHNLHFLDVADFEQAKIIEEELIESKLLQSKSKKNKKQRIQKSRPIILSLDNSQIFIGRNNKENDELSFKIANKNDLWFHRQNYPGSHVILKAKNPSNDDIYFAAQCAAYHSKAKSLGKHEVQMTHAKNLQRIKAAPRGLVKVENHETIVVDLDSDFLAKFDSLLSSHNQDN